MERDQTVVDTLRRKALAALVVGTLATALAAFATWFDERNDRAELLQYEVDRVAQAVAGRLEAYEQALRGGAGLFAASSEVRPNEWQAYVGGLRMRENFPGALAIAYARWLQAGDLPQLEREMLAGRHVYPEGPRPDYAVVIYAEPFTAEVAAALGYDMYADPVRRAAMNRARDSGELAISERVQLVVSRAGADEPAVLMLMPVYRNGLLLRTVEERRAALAGFVHAPLLVRELLRDLSTGGLLLRVVDGSGLTLYGGAGTDAAVVERLVEAGGARWRLGFQPTAEFASDDLVIWPFVLGGGLLISVLLFELLRSLDSSEGRARVLAEQMTQTLKLAEAGHRAVVDSSAEGILTIDQLGTVQSFNRAAEHMFGFSAREVIGQNVTMLMPERFRARHDGFVADFRPTEHGGIIGLRREVVGQHRDGREFPMSLAINVIDGVEPRRFVGVVADISERRASEQALREAEARQRAVLDSSAEGILTIDPKGIVQSFNRAAEHMFGFTANEVIGRNVSMLMPERYRARHDSLVANFDRSGERRILGLRREVVGQHRDGREFPMSLAINIIDGEGPRRFVGVIGDISERRAAERALRASDLRLRLMVESVSDYSILMLDAEGRIATWNAGSQRITGYRADQIIGRQASSFYTGEDIAAGKPARDLERARAEGHCEDEGWRLRQDGSRFWAVVTLAAMRDESGHLIGYSKITRDLSERKRIEGELAEANALRQSILEGAAFGIIATDVAGDIRALNPAAERLLWYRRDELVGQRALTALYEPEQLRLRAEALSQDLGQPLSADFSAISARAARGLADDQEWIFLRRDGSRIPVQVAVTALRDAAGAITGFLAIAYDITARKRQEDYIRHIAQHDALTQLPNRSLLQDRIDVSIGHARRDHSQVAVMMIDLDHFKRINDSLGHHVGDQVLLNVAHRLNACVRTSDSVARMGGDEFVVLLDRVQDLASVHRIARAIVAAFAAPVQVGTHELHLSASVGIACYPQDGSDVASLLRNADTAMYQAKAAGRAGYRMFSADMLRKANEKLELETLIRRALSRGEFVMHYEPQIDLRSGEVVGTEALIRWPHPERGIIAPADFIPVAEETGLIVPVGEWSLRTACREARQMQIRLERPLSVAVNLSPRQFAQPNLIELIVGACRQAELDPRHLVLEITEGTLMARSEETVSVLGQLRALGVRIAVDDFGTGYSSLSYITRFPIDLLKIDRSFVRDIIDDPADAAVARAIIAMAHGLGIAVVAEGVESEAQLQFLRDRACDIGQGYHFGRGSAAASFSAQGHHFTTALPATQMAAKVVSLETLRGRV